MRKTVLRRKTQRKMRKMRKMRKTRKIHRGGVKIPLLNINVKGPGGVYRAYERVVHGKNEDQYQKEKLKKIYDHFQEFIKHPLYEDVKEQFKIEARDQRTDFINFENQVDDLYVSFGANIVPESNPKTITFKEEPISKDDYITLKTKIYEILSTLKDKIEDIERMIKEIKDKEKISFLRVLLNKIISFVIKDIPNYISEMTKSTQNDFIQAHDLPYYNMNDMGI